MKQQIITNLTIIVFLMLITSVFTPAQEEPKTVTDFYLALPGDKYSHPYGKEIKSKAELIEYRKSLITVADLKNGYLKLENNESEGWSEFTLFKKPDGTYIFAISEISCGPGCSGDLQLMTFANGKWTDVTKQLAPKLPQEATSGDYENYWKLPRVGRTLIFVNTNEDVKEEGEKLVYREFKYEWNGTKFIKK